jgi:ribosomal protein S8
MVMLRKIRRTISMFIHLGKDVAVPIKNIIAILDLETTSTSKITKEFLAVAQEEGFIENISEDIPKSFIITEQNKKSKIYLSHISSVTLLKRADFIKGVENSIDND